MSLSRKSVLLRNGLRDDSFPLAAIVMIIFVCEVHGDVLGHLGRVVLT